MRNPFVALAALVLLAAATPVHGQFHLTLTVAAPSSAAAGAVATYVATVVNDGSAEFPAIAGERPLLLGFLPSWRIVAVTPSSGTTGTQSNNIVSWNGRLCAAGGGCASSATLRVDVVPSPSSQGAFVGSAASLFVDNDGDGFREVTTVQSSPQTTQITSLVVDSPLAASSLLLRSKLQTGAGMRFGRSLAAGDFDGNGKVDLAVGAPGETVNGNAGAGAVHLFYGDQGPLGRTLSFHQDSAGIPGVAETGDAFGSALASGDFDGDGFADLAIGTPMEDVEGVTNAGHVTVLFGSATGLVTIGVRTFTQDYFGSAEAMETEDHLGEVLLAADLDGDGLDDLALGVPDEDRPAGANAGVIHVVSSAGGGIALRLPFTAEQGWITAGETPDTVEAPAANDHYGSALASGDFDHDGLPDLAVGVPDEDVPGKSDCGLVEILFGRRAPAATPLDPGRHFQVHLDRLGLISRPISARPDELFGIALAAGQFDRPGRDQLAVASADRDGSVPGSGAVHTFDFQVSGGALRVVDRALLDQSSPQPLLERAEVNDQFGWVLAVGNFDGDDYDDLAAGVAAENAGAVIDSGLVNVLYAPASQRFSAGKQQWGQGAELIDVAEGGDRLGRALAVGDFDGDGIDDLAIGAPDEELAGDDLNHGVVHVLFGGG